MAPTIMRLTLARCEHCEQKKCGAKFLSPSSIRPPTPPQAMRCWLAAEALVQTMQAVAAPPPPRLLQQKQNNPLHDSGSGNLLPAPLASSMGIQQQQQHLPSARSGVPVTEHGDGFSPEVVLSIEASLANLLDVITVCMGGGGGRDCAYVVGSQIPLSGNRRAWGGGRWWEAGGGRQEERGGIPYLGVVGRGRETQHCRHRFSVTKSLRGPIFYFQIAGTPVQPHNHYKQHCLESPP